MINCISQVMEPGQTFQCVPREIQITVSSHSAVNRKFSEKKKKYQNSFNVTLPKS